MTEESVSLKWDEPNDDGGSSISGYVLEQRGGPSRMWQAVKTQEDLEFTVTALKEGAAYDFRVAAKNEVGQGPFAETARPVTPKCQHGEDCLQHCLYIYISFFLYNDL